MSYNFVESKLQVIIKQFLSESFNLEMEIPLQWITATKKEHVGDFTLTVFNIAKSVNLPPEKVATDLGNFILQNDTDFVEFQVIKGFLNLKLSNKELLEILNKISSNLEYGIKPKNGETVLVEFCSPNTNKPLHLGHVRNILLGWSTYKILGTQGYDVKKVQIINDRGIAICKSMLAWKLFGEGQVPSPTKKGDHLVGDMYVLFEQKFKEEYSTWQDSVAGKAIYEEKKKEDETQSDFFKRYKNDYFNLESNLGLQARKMLQKWEDGDVEVKTLWAQLNGWVYDGFAETFKRLRVDFDQLDYESETYLLGKDIINEGLEKSVFYKKPDNSVWIDLTDKKLDHKVVLRADGTSVYITQDIGTANMRYKQWNPSKMIYVVADEQNYHFQALFETMKKLQEPYADGLFHLSYGMVELPSGRMKSREGTVVDADDLIDEITAEVSTNTLEREELAALTPAEKNDIVNDISLAAIKFFILKVQPKKRMIFDPSESVDLQGHTGPYIQNAYVRIQSLLRKTPIDLVLDSNVYTDINEDEKDIILHLYYYPSVLEEASNTYDPSVVAHFAYQLAKYYHKFYHNNSILLAKEPGARDFRLVLCRVTARLLAHSMNLLGIDMPDRM